MSYDLYNPSTALHMTFSRQFLRKALKLAGLYGWQPSRILCDATGSHFVSHMSAIQALDQRQPQGLACYGT